MTFAPVVFPAVTPEREAALVASVPTGLLIGGQWRDASDGGTFDVHDPATGEVLATLASATSEDAVAALDAADKVQASWARTAPRERAEILRRAFDLVTERAEDFALLMTLEMGKPLAEARGEVTYGAEFLRWFSEEAVRDYGRYLTTPEGKNKILVQHKPVGPCLLITPWNFPLAMATRKVAPAVAAGCTMVLKPAKLTPLTAQLFAQTMLDAGLPAGVLNVVSSSSASGISGPLLADSEAAEGLVHGLHPGGQAAYGRRRAERPAHLDGARRERPVHCVRGRRPGQGRRRGHGRQDAEHGRGLHRRQPVPGPGVRGTGVHPQVRRRHGRADHRPRHEPATQVGPLIDAGAREEVHALVSAAVNAGATAITGGAPVEGAGYFYQPTVLAGVPNDAAILRQEIFGPVAPVTTFATEEDAIRLANASEYGLASYVYSRDFNRLLRVAEQIEFGMVGFNAGVISNAAAPFGGVKQSGLGREGGTEGIAEYTTTQYIGIADPYAR